MAGVKISDMTDKPSPDGTELVEVTSDILGTPVTRRVATQDIADLYDLETHASSHENGGSDEVDVTGLSGVLADAQTPSSHASTHEDSGADAVNAGNMSGNISSASEKFEINNGVITGSTDRAAVEFRDETLISSGQSIETSTGGNYLEVDHDSIVIISGTDNIYRINKFTGEVEDSSSVAQNRALTISDDIIIAPSATSSIVREYKKYNLAEYDNITVSGGTTGLVFDTVIRPSDDVLWILNGTTTGNVYTLTRTGNFGDGSGSYTYSSIGSIDTNSAKFCFDDSGTYIYALISNGTSSKIIKYNTSLVLQEQSPVFNEGSSSVYDVYIRIVNGIVVVSCEAGTLYFDESDLTTGPLYSGSTTHATGSRVIDDTGVLFIANEDETSLQIDTVQLPSLTSKSAAYEDHTDTDGAWSTPTLTDESGNNIVVTNADIITETYYAKQYRRNNYIDFRTKGWFTVPSGTASGSFTFETPVFLANTPTIQALPFNAEFLSVVYGSYGAGVNSLHNGCLVYGQSHNTNWVDTIGSQHECDFITSIECDEGTADGTISVTISWDTTNRVADYVFNFHFRVYGQVLDGLILEV